MLFLIKFFAGETFRAGLSIVGLSDIVRVEVSFRTRFGKLIYKFSTVNNTITVVDGKYVFSFSDQSTLELAGSGTWQIEIQSTSAGVKKSLPNPYEIEEATTKRGSETAINTTGFDRLYQWDFTPETPTLTEWVYSFIYVDYIRTVAAAQAAQDSAEEAAQSAADALVSKNTATTKATEAAASAADALTSKNTATTKAGEAAASAADALTSKNTATTKAGEAAASAADALASKNTATTKAGEAAASAADALASKNTATTKAGEAAASAADALASKNTATTKAGEAAASAADALASKNTATTKAGEAAASAADALASKNTATTKAGEAAASAADALASKNTATTKATEAAASAADALASKNTATTKAGEAAASAADALTSKNTATTKATEAAASAADALASKNTATTKAAESLVNANNAAASALAASAIVTGVSTGLPSVGPVINWQFSKTKVLPRSITFSRNSPKTYYDVNGILRTAPAGVPCFSHDPGTLESLGLSCHEASTNVAYNISSLSGNANAIIVPNFAIAPDGTMTASKIENTVNLNSIISPNLYAVITNGFWTRSLYVKANSSTYATIIFEGIGAADASNTALSFNLITKTWTLIAGILIDSGYENCANGWMRIWYTCEKTSANIVHFLSAYIGGYASTPNQHSILIWGNQVENKKYPTPYIYTSGASASRAMDAFSFPSSLIKTGGSFLVESKTEVTDTSGFQNVLQQNSGGDFWCICYNTSYGLGLQSNYGGATVINTLLAITRGIFQKTSFVYANNNSKICINGGTVYSDTDCAVFSTPAIAIGEVLNGYIKQLVYYNQALSNTQLQLLSGTSTNLIGDNPNQLPTSQKLSAGAYLSFAEMAALRQRQEVNYHGTGSPVNYTIRRPYAFTLAIVNAVDSTAPLPSPNADGTYNADTNYNLVHNAAVGKTLTLEIIPVIY